MSNRANELPADELPGQHPQFKVVSHSNLIYFWPVWGFGLFMAILSYSDGSRLLIVPEDTAVKAVSVDKNMHTYELSVPGNSDTILSRATAGPLGKEPFPYRIEQNPLPQLIYAIVLLVVILATSVTLRGLWSVINFMGILILALLLYILGWWGQILTDVGHLHLYLSGAAYVFTSLILLCYWLMVVFVFDQRRFIIFSPGQIIVHREVGDRQEVYDTGSVTVTKRRNDVIRHRLLGLGAGDLIVSTADGRHEFELPNVLLADGKILQISEAMKIRPVMER
jgi:hypothetical protein